MKLSELGQYKTVTDLDIESKREALLKEATLSLDFANNTYEVYEGPIDGLTQRPFKDVLNFTRGSEAAARTATGKIQTVGVDDQRLVGNREGLLIEEQRTNLLLWSEDFTNAAWSTLRISVEEDVAEAPNGEIAAEKIVEDSQNGARYVLQNLSVLENTTYRASVFLKPAGRENVKLYSNAGVSTTEIRISLVDGTLGANSTEGYSLEDVGNGWKRLSIQFTTVPGQTSIFFALSPLPSRTSNNTYQGDGISGIYAWGAQLEQVG